MLKRPKLVIIAALIGGGLFGAILGGGLVGRSERARIEPLETEAGKLTMDLHTTQQTLKSERERATNEHLLLTQERDVAKQALDGCHAANEEMLEQARNLAESQGQERIRLTGDVQTAWAEANQAKEASQQAKVEAAAAVARAKEAETRASGLKGEISSLQTQYQALDSQNKLLARQHAELHKRYEALEAQAKAAEASASSAQTQAQSANANAAAAQALANNYNALLAILNSPPIQTLKSQGGLGAVKGARINQLRSLGVQDDKRLEQIAQTSLRGSSEKNDLPREKIDRDYGGRADR